ncbi:MAG: hypothetical protein U0234_04330 [Sandaracinus sp.]
MRWLSSIAVVLCASCALPTTQLVFEVRGEGAALHAASRLVVRVHGPDGDVAGLPVVEVRPSTEDARVLARVPVVPVDGDETRLVDFGAQLLDASGHVLAEETLYNVAFVHDQLRVVPVVLVSECEGRDDGDPCGLECHACAAEICVPSADGAPCGCGGDRCAAGTCVPRVTVRDVEASSAFVGDSAYTDHTCALAYGGTVSCWGSSAFGALGATGGESGAPTFVARDPLFTALAGSAAAHCTVANAGAVCWGANTSHEVSATGGSVVATPVPRTGAPTIVSQMSGSSAMFVLDESAHLWAWGRNRQAEIGIVTSDPAGLAIPARAASPRSDWTFLAVDGRWIHACAIHPTTSEPQGELWCWGFNGSRETAPSSVDLQFTPVCVDVPGEPPCPADWTSVSVGNYHTCAIRADGSLWCWGGPASGQLGVGTSVLGLMGVAEPQRVPGRWRAVSCGQRTTCAIDDEGRLRCWGAGQIRTGTDPDPVFVGILGDGATTLSAPTPIAVLPPTPSTTWRSVSVAARHACAIREGDQTLWCWGDNREHAVDASSDLYVSRPRRVCPVGSEP